MRAPNQHQSARFRSMVHEQYSTLVPWTPHYLVIWLLFVPDVQYDWGVRLSCLCTPCGPLYRRSTTLVCPTRAIGVQLTYLDACYARGPGA